MMMVFMMIYYGYDDGVNDDDYNNGDDNGDNVSCNDGECNDDNDCFMLVINKFHA